MKLLNIIYDPDGVEVLKVYSEGSKIVFDIEGNECTLSWWQSRDVAQSIIETGLERAEYISLEN